MRGVDRGAAADGEDRVDVRRDLDAIGGHLAPPRCVREVEGVPALACDEQRALHALKGAAATVAAKRIAQAAAALEITLKQGGGPGDGLAELESAAEEVARAIQRLVCDAGDTAAAGVDGEPTFMRGTAS